MTLQGIESSQVVVNCNIRVPTTCRLLTCRQERGRQKPNLNTKQFKGVHLTRKRFTEQELLQGHSCHEMLRQHGQPENMTEENKMLCYKM